MNFDKREMIQQLKIEISLIRDGAYHPSVHEPRREMQVFRDSISCPNVSDEIKAVPCTECYLCHFAAPEKQSEDSACHHIPLNERGDTIASLLKTGDKDRLEAAVLSWLHATIARLEKEISRQEEPCKVQMQN